MANPSIGFLGRFGRSADMRGLDQGLREGGVHPAQVPEGVKLAAARLVWRHNGPACPDWRFTDAGGFLAFFLSAAAADTERADPLLTQRLERAIENPDSADAELVLLALHAKLVAPSVVKRFGLAISES